MHIPWIEDQVAVDGSWWGRGRWTFTLPPYGGSIERKGELKKYERKTFHWQVSVPTQFARIFVGKGKVKGTLEQAKQAVEEAIQTHRREQ